MFSHFWKNISQIQKKLGQVEWTLQISQYFPQKISIFSETKFSQFFVQYFGKEGNLSPNFSPELGKFP